MLDDVAWHFGNSGDKIHLKGLKSPNELGIYDMSGNVIEWCEDKFIDYAYPQATDSDGLPFYITERVIRGGAYYTFYSGVEVINRYSQKPEKNSKGAGLRLVHP